MKNNFFHKFFPIILKFDMVVDFMFFYNFCIGYFFIGAIVLEIFVLKVAKLYICTHQLSAQTTMSLPHRRWYYLLQSALSKPQAPKALLKALLHASGEVYSMYVHTSIFFEHRCLGSNYTGIWARRWPASHVCPQQSNAMSKIILIHIFQVVYTFQTILSENINFDFFKFYFLFFWKFIKN